jgi:hypothetical protein
MEYLIALMAPFHNQSESACPANRRISLAARCFSPHNDRPIGLDRGTKVGQVVAAATPEETTPNHVSQADRPLRTVLRVPTVTATPYRHSV